MWVFIRPRGGQDYYLLMCENRARSDFCPIHPFDGMDQIPVSQSEPIPAKSKSHPDEEDDSETKRYGNEWRGYSLRASLAGRASGGGAAACELVRGDAPAECSSARGEYSGTISFIFSRMAAVAMADMATRIWSRWRRRSVQRWGVP
jgi:hypothetical protein